MIDTCWNILNLNWKSPLNWWLWILKGHSDYLSNLQTCGGSVMLYSHSNRLTHFSWPSPVPVVVYPDWTMWLPCGCQAAPLLCGNWCLWYCSVAMVLWLTGLATCPALAANMVWKGARKKVGSGTGLAGGKGSVGLKRWQGCNEICGSQTEGKFNRS